MKMCHFADAGKTNPIKPNFRGKKMLLRSTLQHVTVTGLMESSSAIGIAELECQSSIGRDIVLNSVKLRRDGFKKPILNEGTEVKEIYYTIAHFRGDIGRWKGRRLEPLVEQYFQVLEIDCSVAVKVG